MNDTNSSAALEAVKVAYAMARAKGKSPKAAFTVAEKKAAKLLGTVRGAWDLASQAQDWGETPLAERLARK